MSSESPSDPSENHSCQTQTCEATHIIMISVKTCSTGQGLPVVVFVLNNNEDVYFILCIIVVGCCKFVFMFMCDIMYIHDVG